MRSWFTGVFGRTGALNASFSRESASNDSFVHMVILGNIASHVDITSTTQRQQLSRTGGLPGYDNLKIGSGFRRSKGA
jgi:hypothetical protein